MKKILKYTALITLLFTVTGCFKKDEFEGIEIYTTTYAIEYITNELYGEYSTIKSIYPDGVNIPDYTITNKKINEFAKSRLFIYNGLSTEKQIAASLINKNKKLDIIDVSQGLELRMEETELWISPSNCLMVAQNIKNGLKENITNTTILEDIDTKYENLKINISEFDAELKLIAENSANKNIIVANNSFEFLTKYGFEITNINNKDEEVSSTAFSRAKKAFSSNENSFIFMLLGTEANEENIQKLVESGATIMLVNPIVNLTDDQRRNGDDYITLMREFIDAIKTEVY